MPIQRRPREPSPRRRRFALRLLLSLEVPPASRRSRVGLSSKGLRWGFPVGLPSLVLSCAGAGLPLLGRGVPHLAVGVSDLHWLRLHRKPAYAAVRPASTAVAADTQLELFGSSVLATGASAARASARLTGWPARRVGKRESSASGMSIRPLAVSAPRR
jgi:hypothetical protein